MTEEFREATVKITAGEVTISEPMADQRNKALIKAEIEGNGTPVKTVFITELLPHCIKSHPWGVQPVRKALGRLSTSEYDKLTKELGELMRPLESDSPQE